MLDMFLTIFYFYFTLFVHKHKKRSEMLSDKSHLILTVSFDQDQSGPDGVSKDWLASILNSKDDPRPIKIVHYR